MGQSLVQIYVHIVFSTKGRKPFLKAEADRERLHAYLSGICKNQDSPAIIVGGVEDHVYLLCRLGKTIDIARLVRNLKSDSSEWAKKELGVPHFYWQTGYGAFSVSPSHVDALTNYIANQVERHRKESFQDEFRRLCEKYGVVIDERFVWD
ncbi:MAG: transposase [Fuerstiella sp.]